MCNKTILNISQKQKITTLNLEKHFIAIPDAFMIMSAEHYLLPFKMNKIKKHCVLYTSKFMHIRKN